MTVKIDRNGYINVNGRPILVRFTYCAGTRAAMEDSRAAGFNTTFHGPKDHTDRAGLLVIGTAESDFPEEDHIINFVIDKPDFYRHEDGALKYPPEWAKERVQEWKRKFPGIPTQMHLYTRASDALTEEYLDIGADIIGLDFWLARAGWSMPLLPFLLDNLRARWALRCSAVPPMFIGLQVSQTDIPVIGQDIPFGTAEQYRTQVYMCLVRGLTGIGCWAYEYTDRPDAQGGQHRAVLKDTVPELWQGVSVVNHEMAEMEPALTHPIQVFDARSVSVRYRVVVSERESWVLAVEELGVPQWAELTLPGCHRTDFDVIAYPGPRPSHVSRDGERIFIREYFPAFQARAYRCLPTVVSALGEVGGRENIVDNSSMRYCSCWPDAGKWTIEQQIVKGE